MGFSDNLLKIFEPTISPCLCDQFTKIIDNGVHPECLKNSRVTPINKEGPLSDPNNYRPISLTPIFRKKIRETPAFKIHVFLNSKRCVVKKKQLGFISKRSTIDALVEVVQRVFDLRSKKRVAHCILLDPSKAFDTVD